MIPTIAFAAICVSAVIQIVFILAKFKKEDLVSHYLLLAASLLLFGTIVDRSIRMNFVAVTDTYESLVFFSGVVCLLLFLYRVQRRIRVARGVLFGGTIVALALLAVSSSPIAPSAIEPPIPALQSYWLVLHVTCSFIGEAFFTVAFVASVYFLMTKDEERKKNLDRLTYTAIGIGYPVFTAGALVFGAIWAKYAWGAYWSWDPKETWALITWLTYTVWLHMRLIRKLKGKATAVVSILGYVFTIFTFFGVNYLLTGLHSYAAS